MTAGEFNELAKQGRVWGKKCDTIISPENVMFEIED